MSADDKSGFIIDPAQFPPLSQSRLLTRKEATQFTGQGSIANSINADNALKVLSGLSGSGGISFSPNYVKWATDNIMAVGLKKFQEKTGMDPRTSQALLSEMGSSLPPGLLNAGGRVLSQPGQLLHNIAELQRATLGGSPGLPQYKQVQQIYGRLSSAMGLLGFSPPESVNQGLEFIDTTLKANPKLAGNIAKLMAGEEIKAIDAASATSGILGGISSALKSEKVDDLDADGDGKVSPQELATAHDNKIKQDRIDALSPILAKLNQNPHWALQYNNKKKIERRAIMGELTSTRMNQVNTVQQGYRNFDEDINMFNVIS